MAIALDMAMAMDNVFTLTQAGEYRKIQAFGLMLVFSCTPFLSSRYRLSLYVAMSVFVCVCVPLLKLFKMSYYSHSQVLKVKSVNCKKIRKDIDVRFKDFGSEMVKKSRPEKSLFWSSPLILDGSRSRSAAVSDCA